MTKTEKSLAYGVMFLLVVALMEWVNKPAAGAERCHLEIVHTSHGVRKVIVVCPPDIIGVDKEGHPVAP